MLKTLSKWLLGLLVLLLVLMAGTTIWFKNELQQLYGAHTELVDHTAFAESISQVVITNTNVLAPDGQSMLTGRNVFLANGKIISVSVDSIIPSDTMVIEGAGKYVIPGLVDSHVHLHKSPNDLLLYVANGITHIRDLGGFSSNLKLREEIEQGRIGPRMFVTSPPINTKDFVEGFFFEFFSFHKTVQTVEQAEKQIRKFVAQGYDAIKTYHLDMPSYRAVNKLAAELGKPTVGHFPLSMELPELKITQQREVAHLEEIVRILLREYGSVNEKGSEGFYAHVQARSDEIIHDLLAKDITINSVLRYMENIHPQFTDLDSALKKVPMEYANPGLVEGTTVIPGYKIGWLPGFNQFEAVTEASDEEYKKYDTYWRAREKAHHILLTAMIEGGVRIVAGSDSGGLVVVPGFGLHDELLSLNAGGMTPAQTLATATTNPAELMNSDAGTIAAGRRADLLILDKNPLDAIENTRSINTVILNGRVFDRKDLDEMLDAVKQANEKSRKVSIDQYL